MTTNSISPVSSIATRVATAASPAARITLISGTNRPGSATRKVVALLEKTYADLGHAAATIDLCDLPAEVFTPAAYAQKPADFDRFVQPILESDGLHIVVPEYNGGAPGVLKYFIDLLPFPESLARRPVCFTGLSAGRWGGLRPVEQLQAIFSYCNALLFPERVFLPGIAQDAETKSIVDHANSKRLQRQTAGFIECASRMSPRVLSRAADATAPTA